MDYDKKQKEEMNNFIIPNNVSYEQFYDYIIGKMQTYNKQIVNLKNGKTFFKFFNERKLNNLLKERENFYHKSNNLISRLENEFQKVKGTCHTYVSLASKLFDTNGFTSVSNMPKIERQLFLCDSFNFDLYKNMITKINMMSALISMPEEIMPGNPDCMNLFCAGITYTLEMESQLNSLDRFEKVMNFYYYQLDEECNLKNTTNFAFLDIDKFDVSKLKTLNYQFIMQSCTSSNRLLDLVSNAIFIDENVHIIETLCNRPSIDTNTILATKDEILEAKKVFNRILNNILPFIKTISAIDCRNADNIIDSNYNLLTDLLIEFYNTKNHDCIKDIETCLELEKNKYSIKKILNNDKEKDKQEEKVNDQDMTM